MGLVKLYHPPKSVINFRQMFKLFDIIIYLRKERRKGRKRKKILQRIEGEAKKMITIEKKCRIRPTINPLALE